MRAASTAGAVRGTPVNLSCNGSQLRRARHRERRLREQETATSLCRERVSERDAARADRRFGAIPQASVAGGAARDTDTVAVFCQQRTGGRPAGGGLSQSTLLLRYIDVANAEIKMTNTICYRRFLYSFSYFMSESMNSDITIKARGREGFLTSTLSANSFRASEASNEWFNVNQIKMSSVNSPR
ncbi:hypothetical protein EVAR_15008_1 [Eumeta japonica]|uniref:Uncharacterized protein n=1 Tax=Eumeta variegata TaxID=151549 RepID=A0A4C1X9V1_EUMVA|nr:hypothetical protein EVAR_15008_1 [Eumeta japonica]